MIWWTGDGHVTLPKPVVAPMPEAAMDLRDQGIADDPDREDPTAPA